MKKRPFDVVTEIALQSLKKSSENFKFNFTQQDQILVWIIGFSIVGTTLLISNILNVNQLFNCYIIKSVLILLCSSIIFGIIYRIFALLFLTKYQQTLFYLEGAFTKDEMMRLEINELDSTMNIHQINQKIENDFGHSYSDIIELHKDAVNEEQKEYYLNYLKAEYINLAKRAKIEYEYSIDYIKGVYKKAFGLKQKTIDKMFLNNNNSFYLKLYRIISICSFLISIGTFITVLIILVANY
ncbi:hypothetical protein [Flavobacterium sp. UBA7682]|uniref:hypothetical protein n=1 Tax=Flavobacterium sp. UBA7682 TaxID=1946560 RepID=UPI0025C57A8C|nr:hypothetical protein [Flavobacterium sp. UBA7682]